MINIELRWALITNQGNADTGSVWIVNNGRSLPCKLQYRERIGNKPTGQAVGAIIENEWLDVEVPSIEP